MKRFSILILAVLCLLAVFPAVTVAETTHTHEYVIVPEKSTAPSCTVAGETYYECRSCGEHLIVTIPAVGHKEGSTVETITVDPTCLGTGEKKIVVYCKHCGEIISETYETLPKTDHKPSEWKVTLQPSCTEAGLQVKTCTVCGIELAAETIPALGHLYGGWITKEATCTEGGYEYRVCGRDSSHIETRNHVPAKGHSWGAYVLTTAPTCTAAGVETSECSVCHETRTRSIPALGHKWDSGVITVEPSCTTTGVKLFTCLNDPSHTYMETIKALGHTWTKWDVDIKPTCTTKGHRWHKCTVCGKTYDESMQPLGHEWGPWVLVREATVSQPGLEQRTCARCGQVEEREVPFAGGGAAMCVFGPRLKDVGTYLNPPYVAWYMFTPFDASVEGRQTYELVVDDTYIVGTATIIVANGTVSLEYELYTSSVQVDLEFFSFLPDMHVLNQYEPEELLPICGMEPGVPYSIADRFGGDTNLVLYFCSRVTYSYDAAGMSPLNYMSTYHQALLNNMLSIMD